MCVRVLASACAVRELRTRLRRIPRADDTDVGTLSLLNGEADGTVHDNHAHRLVAVDARARRRVVLNRRVGIARLGQSAARQLDNSLVVVAELCVKRARIAGRMVAAEVETHFRRNFAGGEATHVPTAWHPS